MDLETPLYLAVFDLALIGKHAGEIILDRLAFTDTTDTEMYGALGRAQAELMKIAEPAKQASTTAQPNHFAELTSTG